MSLEDAISRDECLTKEQEYRKSLTRVHERVDSVEKSTSSIETSAKIIEKSVCVMTNLMYGSEKSDGIITKVSILNQKVAGIYWFSGVVIVAMVGVLVGLIFKKGN